METPINFPGTSFFARLDPQEIRSLEKTGEVRRYSAGEWVAQTGDVWPYFFFIRSGLVTALKESYEGRSLILTTLKGGDIFWGRAFFTPEAPMPASLQASRDTELLRWSREQLAPWFQKDGLLSWELSCLVIQRVQLASDIVEKLAFHPVAGRLAHLLLEQTGKSSAAATPRNLTLDEMAARIGTTREVVCRFLHRFSDKGLIHISRTEFEVADQAGLEELARQVRG
ncbi:MAG: Crp/Fnr family transcriptional regulator [Chloroflexi bacterium]|nr:MAG: Crp/Fnr family transcriptional regulator [Chloroflexota bacterium]